MHSYVIYNLWDFWVAFILNLSLVKKIMLNLVFKFKHDLEFRPTNLFLFLIIYSRCQSLLHWSAGSSGFSRAGNYYFGLFIFKCDFQYFSGAFNSLDTVLLYICFSDEVLLSALLYGCFLHNGTFAWRKLHLWMWSTEGSRVCVCLLWSEWLLFIMIWCIVLCFCLSIRMLCHYAGQKTL